MLSVLYYLDFLISLQSCASLECSAIWASSHMHTYDRINLADCSLATRVRLYRPALLLFKAQHLWDDLELQNLCAHWSADNMGGREEVDVRGIGHSLSICYPVSNAAWSVFMHVAAAGLSVFLPVSPTYTHPHITYLKIHVGVHKWGNSHLIKITVYLRGFKHWIIKLHKLRWEICVFVQASERDSGNCYTSIHEKKSLFIY